MSDDTKPLGDASEAAETTEPAKPQDRKEYMAQYYAENKEEIAARRKAVRLARQEEITAAERSRYASDPAYQEYRINISANERKNKKARIASDPEEKKRHEEQLKKRRERHKERLATDPEYKKKREQFTKDLREKRQKQNKEGDEP